MGAFFTFAWGLARSATAQELPPGYVDPWPVLRVAAEAIGTAKLRRKDFKDSLGQN